MINGFDYLPFSISVLLGSDFKLQMREPYTQILDCRIRSLDNKCEELYRLNCRQKIAYVWKIF